MEKVKLQISLTSIDEFNSVTEALDQYIINYCDCDCNEYGEPIENCECEGGQVPAVAAVLKRMMTEAPTLSNFKEK